MENNSIPEIVKLELDKLMKMSENFIENNVPAHKMEMDILGQLLKIGLSLLNHIIESKLELMSKTVYTFRDEMKTKNTGEKPRKYLSIFGQLEILRPIILTNAVGNVSFLDELLQLPVGTKLSYNIQDLLGENASESDFRESIRVLNKLLNLNLSPKSSERNADRLGEIVEEYYENKPKKIEMSAFCFSASFDGKGVPKIKAATKQKGNPKARLGKGEKRGIMQMATVSVVSHFTPKKQTVEGIIRGLMDSNLTPVEPEKIELKIVKENDNKWHKDIHRRAFLDNQEKAVDYGISDIKLRMKNPDSRFVVPIDAGIGLEDKVLASVKKYGLESQFDGIILDIIHVSEYVWKVGTACFGEKSGKRPKWVKEMLEKILNSEIDAVIEIFEKFKKKLGLSKAKRAKIQTSLTYFSNHKHKMDYKKFIEKGYPVSSALVESACGHLVKERMEQSGMRWSSIGAQNIMDLRAVKLNGDMEDFIDFVIQVERKVVFEQAA